MPVDHGRAAHATDAGVSPKMALAPRPTLKVDAPSRTLKPKPPRSKLPIAPSGECRYAEDRRAGERHAAHRDPKTRSRDSKPSSQASRRRTSRRVSTSRKPAEHASRGRCRAMPRRAGRRGAPAPRVQPVHLAGGVGRAGGGARRAWPGRSQPTAWLRPGAAPRGRSGRTSLDEIQALKENVVQARVDLAALKVEHRCRQPQRQRAVHQDRRAHRPHRAHPGRAGGQAQQGGRDARAPVARATLRRQPKTSPARSRRRRRPAAGPNQPRQPAVDGWVVRDVHRGTAVHRRPPHGHHRGRAGRYRAGRSAASSRSASRTAAGSW